MSIIWSWWAADAAIPEIREVLQSVTREGDAGSFFECSPEEGEAALLHRFVAGGAPARYSLIHGKETGGLVTFDVALPRNYSQMVCVFTRGSARSIGSTVSVRTFYVPRFSLGLCREGGCGS